MGRAARSKTLRKTPIGPATGTPMTFTPDVYFKLRAFDGDVVNAEQRLDLFKTQMLQQLGQQSALVARLTARRAAALTAAGLDPTVRYGFDDDACIVTPERQDISEV